jgi:hypothetical protein
MALESARHMLGHLEDDDLRGSSDFDAVRDAEVVAVPPHLDEPHRNRTPRCRVTSLSYSYDSMEAQGISTLFPACWM